jgi:hypothetical protein
MKKTVLSVAILFLVAASAPAADAKQEIISAYRSMDQFFRNRDSEGLKRFMKAHTTADFYATSGGQKFNLDQNFAQITPLLKNAKKMNRPDTKVESVIVDGTTATAKVYGSFSATVMGRDNRLHMMTGAGKATDHWVKQNGHWLIQLTEAYDQQFAVDGKTPPTPPKMKISRPPHG